MTITQRWKKSLGVRYRNVQYISSRKKTKREKIKRNQGQRAKEVWIRYWREKIPTGYEIHHFDRNRFNRKITNLALVTIKSHDILHKEDSRLANTLLGNRDRG